MVFVARVYLKTSKKQIEFSICPKCEETYNYIDLKNAICPKCNVQTKDLDGYYDNKDTPIHT